MHKKIVVAQLTSKPNVPRPVGSATQPTRSDVAFMSKQERSGLFGERSARGRRNSYQGMEEGDLVDKADVLSRTCISGRKCIDIASQGRDSPSYLLTKVAAASYATVNVD